MVTVFESVPFSLWVYLTVYSKGAGSVTISGGIVDASSPTNVYWEGYEGAPIGNGGNATATATAPPPMPAPPD